MPDKIGKYHVVERIGRGGMGHIFKAHDPVLDRFVALKLISRSRTSSAPASSARPRPALG
jgi:eukaryotic-like serine/threonine-protein kinase